MPPARPFLPDLSRYNTPVTADADFIRGLTYGRLAATRASLSSPWDSDEETAALDIALESIPLSESMSFAFLRAFAAEFRQAYQRRFRAA